MFIGVLTFLLLGSCVKNGPNTNFDLSMIPSDWILLTETDSTRIIFNSCDAGNLLLTITDGKKLLMHGTQEDYEFVIDKAVLGKQDTVLISAHWKLSNEKELFKFSWIDKKQELGNWILLNDNSQEIFVSKDRSSDYPVYNQPCKECWPEEECD